MKLEQQVCSLDLAKRLKELGVKQESLFYWSPDCIRNNHDHNYNLEYFEHCQSWAKLCYVSAFTVAELGELMKDKGMGTTAHTSIGNKWWIAGGEWDVAKQKYFHIEEDDNEANTRAKMLCYLLENRLNHSNR